MHSAIDRWLSSNTTLLAFACSLVIAHAAAGFWSARRGDLVPALALNGLFAAMVLLYRAPALPAAWAAPDMAVLVLLAFEALVLIGSAAALRGWTMPSRLVRLIFAVHALMSVALLVFAFTFRIDRLI